METKSLVTPVGKIKFPRTIINGKEYPYIFVPKNYEDNDSIKSSWSLLITLDPKNEKVKELLSILDEESKKIKGANFKPYKEDKTKDENGDIAPSGLIAINLKSSFPPVIVDAKKQPCSEKIGWGSEICAAFSIKPVESQGKKGLGRYLKAIQVISLTELRNDFGFVEQEGYSERSNEQSNQEQSQEEIAWDDN